MNKNELIEALAGKMSADKSTAERSLNAVLDSICDCLKRGEEVKLAGFGNFDIKQTKAREGRNPATGASISIPASKKPRFKPSKQLKEMVK
ncbi:MAG: HU family DNA-binding protein [Alphaproteobacteria bacterium]